MDYELGQIPHGSYTLYSYVILRTSPMQLASELIDHPIILILIYQTCVKIFCV
jgi:hypothetical protein